MKFLLVPLILLFALAFSYALGSWIVFGITGLFMTWFLVMRIRSQEVAERELLKIERLLLRSGRQDTGGSAEDAVRALLWESKSQERLGSDLSSLNSEISQSLALVRKCGEEGLAAFCEKLGEFTRSSEQRIYILDGPKVVFSSQESGSMCTSLVAQYIREQRPSSSHIYDLITEGGETLFDPSTVRYLLCGSASFSFSDEKEHKIAVALGYPENRLPLPREQHIVAEFMKMMGRALGEFYAVQHVASEASAKQKEQAKHFAHVSHDIRSPLNNIQAILDLFYLEGVTEANKRFLQVARANCGSLRDIVEELLAFTQLKDRNLSVYSESIDVHSVISEVIDEFSLSAEVKHISLRSEFDSELFVEADQKQFKRILMNLVSNGIKYTEDGGEVVLRGCRVGDQIVITITDTGIGIPQEKLHRLFTPFARLGEVPVEGIGLGLALTKLLVESNKGKIGVNSRHGKGSQFSLEFPAVEASLQTKDEIMVAESSDDLSNNLQVRFRDKKLLIIDDDPDAGVTLARLLSSSFGEVQSTCDVAEVRGFLSFMRPDLVLSDVYLGQKRIQEVLSIASEHGIPVIAITGDTQEELKQCLLKEGVRAVVSKPVEPEELLQAINRCLSETVSPLKVAM